MMAIWFIILVALVGLGSLAAVVFAIVYAIANKKPGVALAAVLFPLGAITTVGVLAALLVGRASYQVQGPVHADIHYAIDAPPSPPSPPSFPGPEHDVNPLQVDPDLVIWTLVIFVAVFVTLSLAYRERSCSSGKWNFGKALAVGMLLFLGAKFFFASASPRVEVVHGQQHAAADHAEQVRQDVENAERKAIEAEQAVEDAQRKVEEAAQEKAAQEHGIQFKSMQELWEKLNKPRIELESDDHGASMEADLGGESVKIEAPAEGEAQLIVPISGETPESLARSLARLERMVEQVSNMADQLSDAGTLVGKAMVVLNETIDQKRSRIESLEAQVETAKSNVAPPAIAKVQEPQSAQPANTTTLVSTKKLVSQASVAVETPMKKVEDHVVPPVVERPDWVDMPAKRVGNAQRRVIVAGDFATREECDREADRLLLLAAAEHLAAITGTPMLPAPSTEISLHDGSIVQAESDRRLYLLQRMNLGLDFVRREIAKDEYEETVELSFGPMKRLYTLVEFTPSIDNELRVRWDEFRREKRFAMVGMGAGSVLGLLGMAFGLLKVDTWTKGYYTKRLFLGVPAAIIGLIGLLGLAAS